MTIYSTNLPSQRLIVVSILLFLGIYIPALLFGQQANHHYSMKDGLSADVILCLLQDSQGLIWAGTSNGLNKFDGYQFSSFRYDPKDPDGLVNDIIYCLWEDPQQMLWIGTNSGLNLFDPKTEDFQHVKLGSNEESKVVVIKIRERSDGTVWICTNEGVFLADPKTLSISRPFKVSGNKDEKQALDIAESKNGKVWMSTGMGIVKWDSNEEKLTRYTYHESDPKSVNQYHRTIYIDGKDRIWVGAEHSLDLFNPVDSSFTHFRPVTSESLLNFEVKQIIETKTGNLLIGSRRGLYLFSPDSVQFRKIFEPYVWSEMVDKQQNLWVGTFKGLFQLPSQGKRFEIVNIFGSTRVSDVRVTTVDSNKNIWIVSQDEPNQLFQFNPYTKVFTGYKNDPKNHQSYTGGPVYGIIPTDDGGTWVSSYFTLEKFNPVNNSFKRVDLPFNPVWLLNDANNTLWIGGYSQFGSFDISSNTFHPVKNFQPHTTDLAEDHHRNIWIASWNGLYRYNPRTNILQGFKHDPGDSQSLSSNSILDVEVDQNGGIWLGTMGGLNRVVPGTESKDARFEHWNTTNSDLPFDNVWDVVDGEDGSLWLSSGNQISHYFIEEVRFRNYDHHDGLNGGGLGHGLMGPTGKIYFSSRDGMVVFHPDSLPDNEYIPPVLITGLTINNQPVAKAGSKTDTTLWSSPLTTAITYTESIELNFNQRDFSFEFAALNYLNPNDNQYKYKLEPYETDWIETSADNRIARYTNMSPGKYIFTVIGSNDDGIWNQEGRSLQITIKPPLWATWWAYTLYGLCALGLVLGLRRYEKKRFILKQQAKSLKEIDRVKTEFFTNISHELRTPLTLILGPLKALQDKAYTGDKDSLLAMMAHNGRRLLQLVNQLLDLSKMDQGKLQLELQDCHINQLVEQVLANFDSSCLQKNLRLEYCESANPILCRIDVEKIRQVLYNLVSNAIKFTLENGQIQVSVNSVEPTTAPTAIRAMAGWQAGSQLEIVVKDSGIGIPEEELDHVFDRFYQVKNSLAESEGTGIGLALTKKLVELHDGTIEVKSMPGWGSTFTVNLPLIPTESSKIAPERDSSSRADDVEVHRSQTPVTIQTSHSKPTLLLVEDNTHMRQFMKSILGEHYNYLEAANGLKGLQKADHQIPDLIICDVMMPQMDGYEFCKQVRQNDATSHIPFIFLTAKVDHHSRLHGLQLGSDDYLTKPFEADELRLKVRNEINRQQQLRSFFSKQLAFNGELDVVDNPDNAFLKKAIETVQEHIDNHEFNVQDFSRRLGLSHTQLYRKLMALTGLSPSAFIRSIRLKKAAQLIVQHYGNTSEVAYAVGFNNLSYFTKCFKDQFGVVPSGYLKKGASY